MFNISVLVATYNPDREKLKNTLASILMQQGVSFEIIVCDDCSKCDMSEEIAAYFESRGFKDYRILRQERNAGTVLNMLTGVEAARSTIVKPISPGDYLYDERALDRYCRGFHGEAEVVFGRTQYYSCEDGKPVLYNKCAPFRNIYRNDPSPRKVIKSLVLLEDYIVGASIAYRKERFGQYLRKLSEKGIRFTEDLSTLLFAVDSQKFGYIDEFVIWYEYGLGISTSGVSSLVQDDQKKFFTELLPDCEGCRLIRRSVKAHRLCYKQKSAFLRKVVSFLLVPELVFFRIQMKLQRKKKAQGNTQYYYRIVKEGNA